MKTILFPLLLILSLPLLGLAQTAPDQDAAKERAAFRAASKAYTKLDDRILPKVELKGATLDETLRYIAVKTGVPIDDSALQNATKLIPLTLAVQNIPGSELIKYVANLAQVKLLFGETGVRVVPIPKEAPPK
jgi:hypothetical protein